MGNPNEDITRTSTSLRDVGRADTVHGTDHGNSQAFHLPERLKALLKNQASLISFPLSEFSHDIVRLEKIRHRKQSDTWLRNLRLGAVLLDDRVMFPNDSYHI